MIVDILRPDAGQILWHGTPLVARRGRERRRALPARSPPAFG
jgi:hypothetical protein